MIDIAPAVVAACAALVVAGLGAFLGAKLQKTKEHEHWIREQRLRCSVEFITATRRLLNQYRRYGEAGMNQTERSELRGRMQSARSAIELLCSPDTIATSEIVTECLNRTSPDDTEEQERSAESAFEATVRALRRELDSREITPSRRYVAIDDAG